MPRFYVSLRTQYENAGDLLIAAIMIRLLSERGEIYVDVRNVPAFYLKLFEFNKTVSVVRRGFIWTMMRHVGGSWVYVIKPGGYAVERSWGGSLKKSLMIAYFSAAKLLGAKFLKLPHSLQLGVAHSNRLEAFYCRLMDVVFARDGATLAAYNEIGCAQARLSADLAIYKRFYPSAFLSVNPALVADRGFLAISMRYDRESDGLVDEVVRNFSQDFEIHFLSQVVFDNKKMSAYANRYEGSYLGYDVSLDNIAQLAAVYGKAKFVVSNRLHVLLVGAANGAIPVPFVHPEKDKKVIECLKYFGVSEFICHGQRTESLSRFSSNSAIFSWFDSASQERQLLKSIDEVCH